MNRKIAKLMTGSGIFCCSISLIFFVITFKTSFNYTNIFASLFFAGGIVLICFSLAYYTEK